MAEITHGTVTILLPDSIVLDPRAGNLDKEDIRKLSKARKGIGLACEHAAIALEKVGETLTVPGITPE